MRFRGSWVQMRDGLVLTSGLRALLPAATGADHRAAPASPSDRGTTYVQDLPDLEDLCRSSCMAMRLTVQVQPILQALRRYPGKERYGLEFSEEAGLQPGTAYPILLRLEHQGWVSSRCEDVDPASREAPCSPLLPDDGRGRGTGQRGPRGGMAPQRRGVATSRREGRPCVIPAIDPRKDPRKVRARVAAASSCDRPGGFGQGHRPRVARPG